MKASTLEDYRQRMLRVTVYIQQHLDAETPLRDLAGIAAFSPFHFHRIFRGMVGESVKEYVRRLRLERAAMRLKSGQAQVIEIALEAGYGSHEGFTRAFKAMRGVPPSEFRSLSAPSAHGEPMKVKIKRLTPLKVAFVRHVGPYDQCGRAWEKLCAHLVREGQFGPGAQFIGQCHDDPEVTPPEKIRYDACCVVDDGFQPSGEVGVQAIPGGDYAMTTHFGPYHRLSETYASLYGQWLPRSGRECRSAPSLEFYLTDPENTEPEDLVTDIYAPLEPER